MRIAIAASRRSEKAEISPRAARAPYYFIYESPERAIEVVTNPFGEHERGMGIRMADFLASKKVDLVVARRFGTAFVVALEDKGLRSMAMRGPVRVGAVQAYMGLPAREPKRGNRRS
jgi:predicted Fe-Mo cluster-binding NifX family protein